MPKAAPTALLAVGAAAGAGGAFLGASGVRDHLDAREREDAAEQEYRDRKVLADQRRNATNAHLSRWAELRKQSQTDVVERMRAFLRRNDRQVREAAGLLDDEIDLTVRLVPPPAGDDSDVNSWVNGALGVAAAGAGAAGVIAEAADKYGTASTGTPLSQLHGAAKDKATKAFYGGGSLDSGGGGMALGEGAHNSAIVGVALLAAGTAAKVAGMRAQTKAKAYEVQRAIDRADLDDVDVRLGAVDQRVEEVSQVLHGLRRRALSVLDELEAVAFDSHLHAELFGRAMTFVLAVRDTASTPLLAEGSGDLTGESETLIVRYRLLSAEDRNA